jgi:hypothetical protein
MNLSMMEGNANYANAVTTTFGDKDGQDGDQDGRLHTPDPTKDSQLFPADVWLRGDECVELTKRLRRGQERG